MNLRKEHVVLAGTLLVLGALHFTGGSTPVASRGGTRGGAAPELERHAVPDTSLSLPAARALAQLDRDVFAPPRDTRALPLLELEDPPLFALAALRPPCVPTLDSKLFGRALRTELALKPVPGLFASADDAQAGDSFEAIDSGAAPDTSAAMEVPLSVLTPDQRAALVAGYKRLHDWIRLDDGEPLFGQIRNADRYGLRSRGQDDVLFVEVKPETGAERFPGQKPVGFKRSRVTEFGFADTPSNRIQIRRRDFAGDVGPSQLASLLAFADECVAQRLAAREALAVAEEMYTRAAAVDAQEPSPQLGLARCFEAGFQLEKAYEVYQRLLATYAHRPEVHVGIGELEARLRLFESAESHLREAERTGRSQWRVQLALGRFLFERSRFADALVHLREAYKFEPSEPAAAPTRARIRTALGRALLATGAHDEALSMFEKAQQADAGDPDAFAGRLSALRMGAKGSAPTGAPTGASFELSLARALADLDAGNFASARDGLALAASSDPLRAPEAWRALSWLAESCGYPEEASRWIEAALEGDPTDTWALYQHGRVLASRDDVQGAREAFVRALDREIDFVDALVALGHLAYRTGDHAAAERYLERALSIEPRRPEVLALRGLNFIQQSDYALADESFDNALGLDPLQPLARVGQAWTTYRGGDAEKARTQFAELNDVRRMLPEADPFRRYAIAQMARIEEHISKVVWSDAFERLQLKNDWDVEEAAGPVVSIVEGSARIEGTFATNGAARLYRAYAAAEFVAVELTLTVPSDSNAKVGLFVSKERRVGSGSQVQSKFAIARRRDGGLVVLLMDAATAEEAWQDIPNVGGKSWWPLDEPVRVRIERVGEGNDARGRISIDGIAVREGFKLPRLAASTQDVRVGVFVEGQSGLKGRAIIDDVEVTKRRR
ncbi:MAG: tetratricopeptide repeat protein [Planctomycetes bacterium]|nr:tetratricopeptide repeat protein [Planctomycetota bacterium]